MKIDRSLSLAAIFITVVAVMGCSSVSKKKSASLEERARQFVSDYEKKFRPVDKAVQMAWWDSSISGKEADFKKRETLQNQLNEMLSSPQDFERVKVLHEEITAQKTKINRELARQVHLLYLAYLGKQLDTKLLKEMTRLEVKIEKQFNAYRAKVNGKKLNDNEIRKILKESRDSTLRRKAWEGSKGVGPVIEADLKALVKVRNRAAKKLGFGNYHQMQLALSEHSTEDLVKLFTELNKLTKKAFLGAKSEIDKKLAKNYGIGVKSLRPWHYQDPFFQESPAVFSVDLDTLYKNKDVVKLSKRFFNGIGLSVDGILKRSSLRSQPGKSPHAFCIDIDRKGDVRVLANVVNNQRWMDTMLHELGHGIYSSVNIPKKIPYVLRTESHILTTEGVAMLFGRLALNGVWMENMGFSPKSATKRATISKIAAKMLKNSLLILSRWTQVMFHFEKAMYENPDQNLNTLWWDLVEKYQGIRRPKNRNAPDYASKIHIAVAPVYYHNYMMGELFASQLHHAMARALGKVSPQKVNYVDNKKIGTFLRERVIVPAGTLNWNELTKYATGENLNAKAFALDMGS